MGSGDEAIRQPAGDSVGVLQARDTHELSYKRGAEGQRRQILGCQHPVKNPVLRGAGGPLCAGSYTEILVPPENTQTPRGLMSGDASNATMGGAEERGGDNDSNGAL